MKLCLISIAFLMSNLVFAETETKAHTHGTDNDQSLFHLDQGLINKIHEKSIDEHNSEVETASSVKVGIGFLSANEYVLKNDYFDVDYAEQSNAIPFISISVVDRKFGFGGVGVNLTGQLGYSLSQQSMLAKSRQGVVDVEDSVTIQWLPIHTGLSFDYNFPSATWVVPSIDTGVGASWFHQSGNVDGIDHSEWIAEYGYGVSFTLFASPKTADGFSGIVIGMMKNSSFDSKKKFKGTRYNVGSSIRL